MKNSAAFSTCSFFLNVALLEARTFWPCTWMRTQRKFPGTPFATSLRRPHGADKQWISSWWSLKNGSYVHVICDLPPGVLKTMCVSNVFVPFCALLSFAGVSEEHWKSNGFSTFFHHVLLLNCFGSCVVERKTLKRAGQLWRSGDWTPRQSSVEVGLLGVVWWQMGNQWKSHAVTSYNIAGTRFDQMGPKYSFWIIQDQNCCMGLGEKSQYSQLSFVFFWYHILSISLETQVLCDRVLLHSSAATQVPILISDDILHPRGRSVQAHLKVAKKTLKRYE